MLPIRNISYLSPMCCSFWDKFKNSPKSTLGCSTPLKKQKQKQKQKVPHINLHKCLSKKRVRWLAMILVCVCAFASKFHSDDLDQNYACLDHSHIVLIIGDLNGLDHLPEFADQISGRQILVNGPTRSDRSNQHNMRLVYTLQLLDSSSLHILGLGARWHVLSDRPQHVRASLTSPHS